MLDSVEAVSRGNAELRFCMSNVLNVSDVRMQDMREDYQP